MFTNFFLGVGENERWIFHQTREPRLYLAKLAGVYTASEVIFGPIWDHLGNFYDIFEPQTSKNWLVKQ